MPSICLQNDNIEPEIQAYYKGVKIENDRYAKEEIEESFEPVSNFAKKFHRDSEI